MRRSTFFLIAAQSVAWEGMSGANRQYAAIVQLISFQETTLMLFENALAALFRPAQL